MICPKCGNESKPGMAFCSECGTLIDVFGETGAGIHNHTLATDRDNEGTVSIEPPVVSNGTNNQPPVASNGTTNQPPKKLTLNTVFIIAACFVMLVCITVIVIMAVTGRFAPAENPTDPKISGAGENNGKNNKKPPVKVDSSPTPTPAPRPLPKPSPSAKEPLSTPTPIPDDPPAPPPVPEIPYNSQRVSVWDSGRGWILELEEWEDDGWVSKFQTTAYIGRNGTSTNTREGDGKTPEGTFNILFCYGISQPTTQLRFRQINNGDVFVDDIYSRYYNAIVSSSQISAEASREDTYSQLNRNLFTACIFFDFNGDGETAYTSVSGNGSVRILRGKTGRLEATRGDIDISSRDMTTLLSYLDSSKHPIIIIG